MRGVIRTLSALAVAGVASAVPLASGPVVGGSVAGATTAICDASALTFKLGRFVGAAGSTWYTLEFVNHSSKSCSLSGTPIARPGFMTYGMVPWENVGPKASTAKFAGRGGTVVIAPSKVASVILSVATAENYLPSKCAPRSILGVQVTFSTPANRERFDFTLPRQAVCTKLASTSITGIGLGTNAYP